MNINTLIERENIKKYKIEKDGRTLNAIAKKYKINFDPVYKYLLNSCKLNKNIIDFNSKRYYITYFDGCFYPFLVLAEAEASNEK